MARWSRPIRLFVALVTSLALLLPTVVTTSAMAGASGASGAAASAHDQDTNLSDPAAAHGRHDHHGVAAADRDGSADAGGKVCAADGCALCAALAATAPTLPADAPARTAETAVARGDAGRSDAPETPPPNA